MTDKELRELGVEDIYVRRKILDALELETADASGLQAELEGKIGELEAVKKQAAVERAILEAGGRNVKAILGLIDLDKVVLDKEKGLKGLDLEMIRAEAPYLFHEKTEKKKGTGVARNSQTKKEDEIRTAFWGLR